MSERKPKDEISRLLDSFQEEDILEEKMEGFTAQKRRKDRLEKQQHMPNIPLERSPDSREDTVVLRPETPSPKAAGETVMFDPEQIEKEDTDTNKTVVINDNEIQSLLEEDKPPKLRREVVSSSRGHSASGKKHPVKKKGMHPAAIAAIVLAALLMVGMIGFGVYTLVSGNADDKTEETTKKQKQAYQDILDWLDSVSDGDFTNIEDFEKDYNSLTDKQKKELNEYFEKMTGSTFDELLAKVKSDSKKESSNNNAKVAELKAQLNTLKSQLSDAQSTLNEANSTLSQSQSEYENWNSKLSAWQDTNSQLQQKQTELTTLENRMTELQNIPADQISEEELTELTQSYTTQANLQKEISNLQGQLNGIGDYNTIQSNVSSASSHVSQAQSQVDSAQSTIDQLTSQIQDLENQIEALE